VQIFQGCLKEKNKKDPKRILKSPKSFRMGIFWKLLLIGSILQEVRGYAVMLIWPRWEAAIEKYSYPQG